MPRFRHMKGSFQFMPCGVLLVISQCAMISADRGLDPKTSCGTVDNLRAWSIDTSFGLSQANAPLPFNTSLA
jgi:hypothetical protein